MKLNVKAFALTTGLVWGLGLLLLTWWIIAWDGPSTAPTWIGRIYRGYTLTAVGSVVGAIWGFFDGLIGGAVFAWVYNVLVARLGK